MIARNALLVLFLVLAGLWGCDSDTISVSSLTPTLENIWPSEDGRQWDYVLTSRSWFEARNDSDFIYPDSLSVPPLAGLAEIRTWLDPEAVPDSFAVATAAYRLRFKGTKTTQSGITGQNLVAEMVPPLQMFGPLLIRGGAWEKTEDWIGFYGDLNTSLAWKLLDANLERGSTFTHPLAGSSVLTCWIERVAPVDTPVGTFENAVWCVYRVDTGILCRDTVFDPDPPGCTRVFYVGRVVYAPTVGPVYGYERVNVYAGDPEGWGWGDTTLELVGIRAGG